jgi:hypothetical protein
VLLEALLEEPVTVEIAERSLQHASGTGSGKNGTEFGAKSAAGAA